MSHPLRTTLVGLTALSVTLGGLLAVSDDRAERARHDALRWNPGVRAGRLQVASPAGGYVDLGAPLEAHEAAALATYRVPNTRWDREPVVPRSVVPGPQEGSQGASRPRSGRTRGER